MDSLDDATIIIMLWKSMMVKQSQMSGHVSLKSKPQDTGKAQGSQSNGACVNTWSDANIVFDCIP